MKMRGNSTVTMLFAVTIPKSKRTLTAFSVQHAKYAVDLLKRECNLTLFTSTSEHWLLNIVCTDTFPSGVIMPKIYQRVQKESLG